MFNQSPAERQRKRRAKAKEAGEVFIGGFSIPGDLHVQLTEDAKDLGIPLKDLILRKLYRGAGVEE